MPSAQHSTSQRKSTRNASSNNPSSGQAIAPPTYGVAGIGSPIQRVDAPSASPQPVAPNRTGLPDRLKAGIESLSGYSMDDVKVHYNSDKPTQLNAHAYAQGTNIHVASGQEKHLPHEAWHIVQQKQGRVKPTMQMKGKVNINDDAGLEKEADVMGSNSLQFTDKNEIEKAATSIKSKRENKDLIQLRSIGGTIEKKDGKWLTKGESHTPTPVNNTTVRTGTAPYTGKTNLLNPNNRFIWGHLIKAAWDNGNDMSRLTLWNQDREAKWTKIEQEAQQAVNTYGRKGGTFPVSVITKDIDYGNIILGLNQPPENSPRWYRKSFNIPDNIAPIENVRNALNSVITSANMKITDDKKVIYNSGEISMGKPHELTKLGNTKKKKA